ncbi:hypothetical protein JVU11DRAFT_5346 [Chiua virens]|nr:hypothetical protein JVU11DRAFT_5346 [Chiua virens]
MCGIFCSLRAFRDQEENSASEAVVHVISDKLKRANAARGEPSIQTMIDSDDPSLNLNAPSGPDAQHATSISLPARNAACTSDPSVSGDSKSDIHLYLYASELRLRGDTPIVQPHIEGGDVLCWNGEIDPTENDGQKIFKRLRAAAKPLAISETIGNIEGPYAFVFYHVGAIADRQFDTHLLQERSKKLYFARDPLGRRSLLIHKPTLINPIFLLSSVSAGNDTYEFEELSTDGIFVLDLDAICDDAQNFVATFHSHLDVIPRGSGEHVKFGLVRKVNRSLPPDDLPRIQGIDSASLPMPLVEATEQLINQLDRSVMLHVRDIPQAPGYEGNARVAILFSGGIDSTVLAFFAHQYATKCIEIARLLTATRHIPLNEPIDLLNVAFENPRKVQLQLDGNVGALPKRKRKQLKIVETDVGGDADRELSSYMVPDRVTGLQELEELRRLCPGRVWNFVSLAIGSPST